MFFIGSPQEVKVVNMNTDPVADMLTRIRNANIVSHTTVEMPSSKLKVALAKLLKEEGFIVDYSERVEGHFKYLTVVLKYDELNKPVITNLRRISKPGLRNYCKAKNLPQVLGGLGIAIVSTSKGLLTDRKARKENLGGEILCYVY
ncbi:MAG: 30S ribosomal protein S8 [bacterium]|nr:30S ribosomal protein S8 [bacterium]